MSLKELNPQQKKAVSHKDGPLLIVAGAGTGKTTVITERVAWLIDQGLAKADEILALTFTDKAATEMEERVDKLLPYGYVDLWIMTFHSFGERILKNHALDIGIPNDFKLLNQTQQWMLVRENLDKFNLDYYRPLGNPTKFIHALVKHFSRCKDEIVAPEDYVKYAEGLKIDLDKMESTGGKGKRSEDVDESEVKRLEEVANAYHIYQQLLLDNQALDFGDLINYALKLFKTRSNILKFYQNKFKYILVDEFQDTNYAQYELVKLLAGAKMNLTVVGDDDQCLPADSLVDTLKGRKKIKDIIKGDEVITAVGKGHLGVQKVNRVFKNKKKANLLTVKLRSGKTIKITDNHKMFCYVPQKADGNYCYVYLMFRQDLGWRIGITNNLSTRLRLERSADKILAVRAFKTEAEARYYETLWSLNYGIPTACFKERDSLMIKKEWLDKLYRDIDVNKNVKKFSQDLNIDLNNYHYCLNAVTRGRGKRILIHLEMCYRRYRSKEHVRKKRKLMYNNLILHKVSVETSNKMVIDKLQKAGYKLCKARVGKRLIISNSDIKKIGEIALKIQKITDGFISYKFNLGKINYQHLPALVMPAKNLVEGHYLPIRQGKGVFYDQIVDIKSKKMNQYVYDLEVDRTHNFIANGVVVHNSIYKFRGASVSNILQFKDDYPKSVDIYLNKNYRSSQNILDMAYNFIQLNNPERLEVKLGNKELSKKLEAATKDKGKIEHLHLVDENQEVETVINKIIELKNSDSKASWNDFAILVRANNQAEAFLNGLAYAGVPFNFVASKGLYSKPVIRDILAYLKLLDDYHESMALWRILNLEVIKMDIEDLMELTKFARRKAYSLYETISQAGNLRNISEQTKKQLEYIIKKIKEHTQLAKEKSIKLVIYQFLKDFKYYDYLIKEQDEKSTVYLNSLLRKIDEFEKSVDDKSLNSFMGLVNLELESGEQGDLPKEAEEGPEAVRIMTIHSAKGLEFKYVCLVNLVDKRFPSMQRREAIELPDELVKEIVPEGDIHLQEERRLFYVALTRAKREIYFSSAENYGGKTKKKLSRFLYESGMEKKAETKKATVQKIEPQIASPVRDKKIKYELPATFSYSQLKAFENCPYQYYLNFILKLPVMGKATFSYGRTMHTTLQKFMALIKQTGSTAQAGLFEGNKAKDKKLPALSELLGIYKEVWIDDWFETKQQKEDYKKLGEKSLREFHAQLDKKIPKVLELEKGFNFKVGEYTVRGVMDRVDEVADGKVEIIDYKTGSAKTEKTIEKDQLLMYQIASQEVFDWQVDQLTFYYLDNNKAVSFLGSPKELEKIKDKILGLIENILKCDWQALPSQHKCKYCDFKEVCQFRQL